MAVLTEKVAQTKIGETGYPFMVGNDGLFIYHPVKDYICSLNITTPRGWSTFPKKLLSQEVAGLINIFLKGLIRLPVSHLYLLQAGALRSLRMNRFLAPVVSIRSMVLAAG